MDGMPTPGSGRTLKGREPERYQVILELYRAWAGQLPPLDPEAYTHGYSGRELADPFGVQAHGPG
jgi:hypothetical protein